MFKLANQVIDAYDDVSRIHLRKIAAINPDIEMMASEERNSLEDEDFALSIITKKASKLNKFPINTHDSAWLSNRYFEETCFRLPKTAAAIAAYHIKRACEQFKIAPLPNVVGMAKEANSNMYFEEDIPETAKVTKTATPNLSEFAEIQKIGDNYTFAQYAFSSPAHVKMASQYFDKFCDKMPVDYRHKYAAAIQRRAHELGMETQKGQVIKYASDHYSGHLDAHLASRRSLLEVADPKYAAVLDKLAAAKKQLSPQQFSRALHGFDKKAGLSRYYGNYLTNPYEATFANVPDPYEGWKTKVAGVSLDVEQLKSVVNGKYAEIKNYFGQSVADELRKDPVSIFESLPNDVKGIIAQLSNGEL